jgi:hypothetical protein
MSMTLATKWTLDEGLDLSRALQPVTRKYGYHLTLGGGVLNKGESNKDLDLFFLPMDSTKPDAPKTDPAGLIEWLDGLWGVGGYIGGKVDPTTEEQRLHMALPVYEGLKDSPYWTKRKYNYHGLRIDVFLMEGAITLLDRFKAAIDQIVLDEELSEQAIAYLKEAKERPLAPPPDPWGRLRNDFLRGQVANRRRGQGEAAFPPPPLPPQQNVAWAANIDRAQEPMWRAQQIAPPAPDPNRQLLDWVVALNPPGGDNE